MLTDMLKKAFKKHKKHKNFNGLLLPSDQGCHYQYSQYQKILRDYGVVQSMFRKGNCLDNSMMENFFGLMKNGLLYVNNIESIDSFETELNEYIRWYNAKRIKLRIKLRLKVLSPGSIPNSIL